VSGVALRALRQTAHSGLFFALTLAARVGLVVALGRSLTPAEFGVYSLVAGSVGVATLILQLGAQHYVLRQVPGRPAPEAVGIFKSVLLGEYAVFAAGLGIGFVTLGVLGPWRSEMARAGFGGVAMVALLVIAVSLAQDVARFLSARAEIERYNLVTFLEGGAWALGVSAAYLGGVPISLAVVLGAWLTGAALAVGYGFATIGVRQLAAAPADVRLYPVAVRFGVPLLGTWVASLVLSWSDRYFVAAFHSAAAVGVYSYHYNLVAMIIAVAGPLAGAALDPHVIAAYNRGDEARSERLLGIVLRYRLMVVLPLVIVAVVWGGEIVVLLARADYAAGTMLMLALAPIPILHAVAVTYERVLYIEGRTVAIGSCYLISAAANLVLNVLLVPWHPYYGAALATDLAMLLLGGLLWRAARGATLRVRVAAARLVAVTAIAIVAALVIRYALAGESPAIGVPVGTLVVVVTFGLACLAGGLVPAAERQAFAQFLGRTGLWRHAQ
jgi:O-antigen/teichoic acid export membrane protein